MIKSLIELEESDKDPQYDLGLNSQSSDFQSRVSLNSNIKLFKVI